jgi:single-stranded DNA-specific DHH superfamily exonuclease
MLHQTRLMKNQVARAINMVDTGLSRIKSFSFAEGSSLTDTRKSTATKLPALQSMGRMAANSHLNEEDCEIDKVIERKMVLSQKLREKLYKEKKEMTSSHGKESSESKSLNFFLSIPKKTKKKIPL